MRRILLLFIALTLLCSVACAEAIYSFQHPVYPSLTDRTLSVTFQRRNASNGGVLLLTAEDGTVLAEK